MKGADCTLAQLFDQLRVTGHLLKRHVLGAVSEAQMERIMRDATERFRPLHLIIGARPDFLDDHLSAIRYPHLYMTTEDWPAAAPAAGYVQESEVVTWELALRSTYSLWSLELCGNGADRVLRAALYAAHTRGLAAALTYLIDLVSHGILLRGETLGEAAFWLLHAASSEEELYRICTRRAPRSHLDWIELPVHQRAHHPKASARFTPLLAQWYHRIFALCTQARKARTSDEWLMALHCVKTFADSIKYIRQIYSPSMSLTLRVLDEEIEEFSADAFPQLFQRLDEYMDYREFPFAVDFVLASAVGLAYAMSGAEQPRRTVLERRILVPDVLNGAYLAGDSGDVGKLRASDVHQAVDAVEPGWRVLSAKTAPIHGAITLSTPDTIFYSSHWPPADMTDDGCAHPDIVSMVERSVRSPLLRLVLWMRLLGKDAQIQELLTAEMPNSPRGNRSHDPAASAFGNGMDMDALEALCVREGTTLSDLAQVAHRAYLQCNNTALNEQIRPAMERVEESDPSVEPMLRDIVERWPYFAPAHTELAILQDKLGRHDEALTTITKSILLDPMQGLNWQVLAVITSTRDCENEEALIYAALAMTLEEEEANNDA